jgi:hypothetical protein
MGHVFTHDHCAYLAVDLEACQAVDHQEVDKAMTSLAALVPFDAQM